METHPIQRPRLFRPKTVEIKKMLLCYNSFLLPWSVPVQQSKKEKKTEVKKINQEKRVKKIQVGTRKQ